MDALKTPDILRHVAAVAIPVIVFAMHLLKRGKSSSAPPYFSEWSVAQAGPETQEATRQTFFTRLKLYQDGCVALTKNTYYWILFIGLTMFILISKDGTEVAGVRVGQG